ncbi:unnamed protein product, partial [Discosporangium mesarthrocarpum]
MNEGKKDVESILKSFEAKLCLESSRFRRAAAELEVSLDLDLDHRFTEGVPSPRAVLPPAPLSPPRRPPLNNHHEILASLADVDGSGDSGGGVARWSDVSFLLSGTADDSPESYTRIGGGRSSGLAAALSPANPHSLGRMELSEIGLHTPGEWNQPLGNSVWDADNGFMNGDSWGEFGSEDGPIDSLGEFGNGEGTGAAASLVNGNAASDSVTAANIAERTLSSTPDRSAEVFSLSSGRSGVYIPGKLWSSRGNQAMGEGRPAYGSNLGVPE